MTTDFRPEFLIRQSDLLPSTKLAVKINIIGAGAIGSHTAMALARMGLGNITVYDYDVVDEMNMNNQGYDIADIGRPKVEVLKEKIKKAIGFDINIRKEAYDKQTLTGIVISCVDSMTSREAIWKGAVTADFFIDGRMGAEYARLFVMHPVLDARTYPKTITPDEEAVREPCTAKSTIYTAYLLSGMICKAVKDIITKHKYTRVVEWNIRENAMLSWCKDA